MFVPICKNFADESRKYKLMKTLAKAYKQYPNKEIK